ncbi:MAG: exosortase/archaeosortase family protein [Gemmatimonadota bacterium]|nr:exosortase/archaeosortase family protein [Gemmatimonadota bacterium]
MNAAAGTLSRLSRPGAWLPATVLVAASYLLFFWPALVSLVGDWASSGEYGHGFLMAPLAVWLAAKRMTAGADPARTGGLVLVGFAVCAFLFGSLAGELFTQRLGALVALAGLAVYYRGWSQLAAWWLPFALLASAVPLPDMVLDTLTLPLQLLASDAAVWLLQARHIPAGQAGNVIFLPGHELFVAAACSGLRSISALLGLTILIAGTYVTAPLARVCLVVLAVPAAIAANVVRVFATGFLVYYFGAGAATGLMHHAMGAVAFVLPLALIAFTAWALERTE